MTPQKGSNLEELVRSYFYQQGYFCLRGVSFRFDNEEVTDLDVWLYGKQGASVRTRVIVDVKNKRSPKAFERILWTKGMQLAIRCDRAIVATTDADPKVKRFADEQGVALLTKDFIARLERKVGLTERLTKEEFAGQLALYPSAKQDGDWIGTIESVRASVVSTHGFAAFNRSMSAFSMFAQKIRIRPQYAEQALRCALLSSAVACIALDSALSRLAYEDHNTRFQAIDRGVAFGDSGDGRVQQSISSVLDVIAAKMSGGKAIAAQARSALDSVFASVRSEIVAEYFAPDTNASHLFKVARELEELAHYRGEPNIRGTSAEAKAAIGVFADFVDVPRAVFFGASRLAGRDASSASALDQENIRNLPEQPEGKDITQEKLL